MHRIGRRMKSRGGAERTRALVLRSRAFRNWYELPKPPALIVETGRTVRWASGETRPFAQAAMRYPGGNYGNASTDRV